MKQLDVHIVACPHCGWSFMGTSSHGEEGALRALRDHLATKHDRHPPEAELRSLIQSARKTPQP